MTRKARGPLAWAHATRRAAIHRWLRGNRWHQRLAGVCSLELRMPEPTRNRRYPRWKAPKGLSVAWQNSTKRWASYVEDLCLGGLFIRTKEPPSVGTALQLLIDIPNGGVRARGIVRAVRPEKGMGVGIISMTQEDRQRLSSFLRNLGPP